MPKNTSNNHSNNYIHTSPEAMIAELQERIDLLQSMQEAIRFVYSGVESQPLAEATPQPKKKRRRANAKVKASGSARVKNSTLVIDVLQGVPNVPCSLDDIITGLTARGWTTSSSSTHPREVVRQTLLNMERQNKVQRSPDGHWMLTESRNAETVASTKAAA